VKFQRLGSLLASLAPWHRSSFGVTTTYPTSRDRSASKLGHFVYSHCCPPLSFGFGVLASFFGSYLQLPVVIFDVAGRFPQSRLTDSSAPPVPRAGLILPYVMRSNGIRFWCFNNVQETSTVLLNLPLSSTSPGNFHSVEVSGPTCIRYLRFGVLPLLLLCLYHVGSGRVRYQCAVPQTEDFRKGRASAELQPPATPFPSWCYSAKRFGRFLVSNQRDRTWFLVV